MGDTPESKIGKTEVRQSDADDFELGAEVDGVWTSFVRIPGEQVRANVANRQATDAAASQEPS
jgi:hypothetical protein